MTDIKFPSMGLSGKAAVVTGAGQGLGLWMALGLAHAGADVAIAEINPETGRLAAEEVKKLGRRSFFQECDVRRVDSTQAMIDAVVRAWGRIDILVNNAGVNIRKKVVDAEPADFDAVVAVNLRGAYFCAQAAGKVMIGQKQGKIINVASAGGILVRAGVPNSVYALTKAGVIMMTKSMAEEWSRYNINVNAVAPGYFETPLVAPRMKDPKIRQAILDSTPMNRLGGAEDIIGPIVFLASEAAGFITGACLCIDGGRTVL